MSLGIQLATFRKTVLPVYPRSHMPTVILLAKTASPPSLWNLRRCCGVVPGDRSGSGRKCQYRVTVRDLNVAMNFTQNGSATSVASLGVLM